MDPRLGEHFSLIVIGSSGAGKTTLIDNLLQNPTEHAVGGRPDAVVLCYNYPQSIYSGWYSSAPVFLAHRGWPTEKFIQKVAELGDNVLVIFDDMEEMALSKKEHSALLSRLFTGYRHHLGLSLVWTAHELFPKHEFASRIARNTQYLALLTAPQSANSLSALGGQLGTPPKFLRSAYTQAKQNDRPLVIDQRPRVEDRYRYREGFRSDHAVYYVSDDKT